MTMRSNLYIAPAGQGAKHEEWGRVHISRSIPWQTSVARMQWNEIRGEKSYVLLTHSPPIPALPRRGGTCVICPGLRYA